MLPRTAICVTLLACVSWFAAPQGAEAQSRAAVRHYERGRDHYQAGRYPEAAVELEEAHRLDPNSPTLAYNLARVYELMGEYDRATVYYSRLSDMTAEDDEQHVTAQAALERVRGAQAALEAQRAQEAAADEARLAQDADEREEALRQAEEQARAEATAETERRLGRRGRADALFYGSAILAVGTLAGGSVLGFYALRKDNEADDWVVGANHTEQQRFAQQQSARRMAIGADLLLGTGVAAGVSALLLYYLRERHPPERRSLCEGSFDPLSAGTRVRPARRRPPHRAGADGLHLPRVRRPHPLLGGGGRARPVSARARVRQRLLCAAARVHAKPGAVQRHRRRL
jgi:tetratricopeptide (TPR) repeat protein